MLSSFSISNIKCTKLANIKLSGHIDPFVTIVYRGVSRKTEFKGKEFNPVYDESFDFDLCGKEITGEDQLEITVKDYERLGRNRLVGKCTIPLSPLCKPGTTSHQFTQVLNDKNGRPTTGKIEFVVKYELPPGIAKQLGDKKEMETATQPNDIHNSGSRKLKRIQQKRKPHGLPKKPTDFQVRIKIIEGREISGGQINPVVRLRLGNEKKNTRVKFSTNKPYFNETFFFNFNEKPDELLNKVLHFEIFNSVGIISNALLGTFKCDLGLIYDQPEHAIIRKWVLMSKNDQSNHDQLKEKKSSEEPYDQPSGYLNEIPVAAKVDSSSDEEDDIESNLLIPTCCSLRQTTFLVKVYRGEDFPQMDSTTLGRVTALWKSELKGHSDPYVRFSFAGHSVKTNIKYADQNPEFNEEIRVKFGLPSMCDKLKLQIFDWDRLGNDNCIGTTFIYLSAISGTGDDEPEPPTNPDLGPPDQRLALHILNRRMGRKFVPEHVETRSLKNPLQPNKKQGKLEMFVQTFSPHGSPGPPINITPRKPRDYQLRVIIWNTAEVPQSDVSVLGEQMSDIYVKGWMKGSKELKKKTDVHYRCMEGEGMFNWRLCFPFRYIPEEKIMIVEKKSGKTRSNAIKIDKEKFWSLKKTKQELPPIFIVQVWDMDLFSRNDFIGKLELDLTEIPLPSKKRRNCSLEQLELWEKTVDLFEAKQQRGWWPLKGEGEQIKGKVEMTLEILTDAEVKARPVGQGHDEPNSYPKLDAPRRPESSFLWITSPLKSLKHIIWKKYKCYIIGFLISVVIFLFIFLIFYSIPGNLVAKII